ncbi:hypothetical protein [Leifsonia aquatica]|uniref:hypothetical protein n=1 Tax=Leifsonia aquatica TaxID=144185 RepID=UPI0004696E6E|nr:hypothetical protein [Leifsonia aquatica]
MASNRALRRIGGWGAVALAGVLSLLLAAGLVGVIVHADADADYQVARHRAMVGHDAVEAAQRRLASSRGRGAELRTRLRRIHDTAQRDGSLLPPKVADVAGGLELLDRVLVRRFTVPAPRPRPHGTDRSSTEELQAETKRLFALAGSSEATARLLGQGADSVDGELATVRGTLERIVLGGRPDRDGTAVPDLRGDAGAVAHSARVAPGAARDEVLAAAEKARHDVAGGADPSFALLHYLARVRMQQRR